MEFPSIVVGDSHTLHRTVTEDYTAGNYWSDAELGELLSTPGLISMMIEASVHLIDSHLPKEFMSIGKSAAVQHEHPCALWANVAMTVEIREFDGYHVTLEMNAFDGLGLVARGTHVRSIVNKRWMRIKVDQRVGTEISRYVM